MRKDVATLGAGWNPTLEWYALAIEDMSKRSFADRTSWLYLGAIHGFDRPGWIGAGLITAEQPAPPASEIATLFDQCQHGGWYFLPWHRGYLAAFEAIIAATVAKLGGPTDWTLPYWNYFDTSKTTSRDIPQPFLDATMPNGKSNPLSRPPRAGLTTLGAVPGVLPDITLGAMTQNRYTSAPGTVAFGGGSTGFLQFASAAGAEELNPHNRVHVMIGGWTGSPGFMSDPDYAALDPIFWLHHCNIDRLWAAWLTQASNVQETGAPWRSGPTPRQFTMPTSAGGLAVFTPGDTLPGGSLAPIYDDLSIGTGVTPPTVVAGAAPGGAMPSGSGSGSSSQPPVSTPVGSNTGTVTVGTGAATTVVNIIPGGALPAGVAAPERLFLNLENVKGTAPSGILRISVRIPAQGTLPASVSEHVDTVALFGLAKASATDGAHGGNGLSVSLDITDLAGAFAAQGRDLGTLEIRIEQPDIPDPSPITVERVSVFSQPAT